MSQSGDVSWMHRCKALAAEAARAGNTPVGCVIVIDGAAVAEAAEQVPRGDRRFAHAELLAIESAVRSLGRRTMESATLYSTAEPCILCGYAIRETRIGRVVVGRPSGETGSIRSRVPVLTVDGVERWGPPPDVTWWTADE